MKSMERIQKYIAARQYHCQVNRNIKSGCCMHESCQYNRTCNKRTDECTMKIKVDKMLEVLSENK